MDDVKALIERLRQLEVRITMGANETCGAAATALSAALEREEACDKKILSALMCAMRLGDDEECRTYNAGCIRAAEEIKAEFARTALENTNGN